MGERGYELGGTYKVANKDYIGELQRSYYDEKAEKCVKQLCLLWCLGDVFIPYSLCNG